MPRKHVIKADIQHYQTLLQMTSEVFSASGTEPELNFFDRSIPIATVRFDALQAVKQFEQDWYRTRPVLLPGFVDMSDEQYLDAVNLYLNGLGCHLVLITAIRAYCTQHYLTNPLCNVFSYYFMHFGWFAGNPNFIVDLHLDPNDFNKLELEMTAQFNKLEWGPDEQSSHLNWTEENIPLIAKARYTLTATENHIHFFCTQFELLRCNNLPEPYATELNQFVHQAESMIPDILKMPEYLQLITTTRSRIFENDLQIPEIIWKALLLGLAEAHMNNDQLSCYVEKLHYTQAALNFYKRKNESFSIYYTVEPTTPEIKFSTLNNAHHIHLTLNTMNDEPCVAKVKIVNCQKLSLTACTFTAPSNVRIQLFFDECLPTSLADLIAFQMQNKNVSTLTLKKWPVTIPKELCAQFVDGQPIALLPNRIVLDILNFALPNDILRDALLALQQTQPGYHAFLSAELLMQRERLTALTKLPQWRAEVAMLSIVNLSNTQLNDRQLLPLQRLSGLRQFILHHNPILELPRLGSHSNLEIIDMQHCARLRGVDAFVVGLLQVNFQGCEFLQLSWLVDLINFANKDTLQLTLPRSRSLTGHVHIAHHCFDFTAADLERQPEIISYFTSKIHASIPNHTLRPALQRPMFADEKKLEQDLQLYFRNVQQDAGAIQDYIQKQFSSQVHEVQLIHLQKMLQSILRAQNSSRNSGIFWNILSGGQSESLVKFYQHLLSMMLVQPEREDKNTEELYQLRALAIEFLRLFYIHPDVTKQPALCNVIQPVLRSVLLPALFSTDPFTRFDFLQTLLNPSILLSESDSHVGTKTLLQAYLSILKNLWSKDDYLDYLSIAATHLSDAQLANFALFYLQKSSMNDVDKEIAFLFTKKLQEPGILIGQAIGQLKNATPDFVNVIHLLLDQLYLRLDKNHWHERQWHSLVRSIHLFDELTQTNYAFKSLVPGRKITAHDTNRKGEFNFAYTYSQRSDILQSIFNKVFGQKTKEQLHPFRITLLQEHFTKNRDLFNEFLQQCQNSTKLHRLLTKNKIAWHTFSEQIENLAPEIQNPNLNADDDEPVIFTGAKNLTEFVDLLENQLPTLKNDLRGILTSTCLTVLLRISHDKRTLLSATHLAEILSVLRFYADFTELSSYPKNPANQWMKQKVSAEEITTYSTINELFLIAREIIVEIVRAKKGVNIESEIEELFSIKGMHQRDMDSMLRKLGDDLTEQRTPTLF